MTAHVDPDRLLEAALTFAASGLAALPLREKVPRTTRGLRDASSDPEVIQEWWSRWPEAGVGVRTGEVRPGRHLVVLDRDGDHGGDSLADLEREHGALPETPRAVTPRGEHYWFASPTPISCSVGKLAPGLDIRASGGYVVAPPTVITTGAYVWDLALGEVAPAQLPTWLYGRLTPARGPAKAQPCSHWRRLAQGVGEGERNQAVASIAGHLLARRVDPHIALALIVGWDQAANRPPIGREEIERTVESVGRLELARRSP